MRCWFVNWCFVFVVECECPLGSMGCVMTAFSCVLSFFQSTSWPKKAGGLVTGGHERFGFWHHWRLGLGSDRMFLNFEVKNTEFYAFYEVKRTERGGGENLAGGLIPHYLGPWFVSYTSDACTRDLTTCSLQVDLHKQFARLSFFLVYVLFLTHFSHRIEPQLHNVPAGLSNGAFSPLQ